MKTVLCYGDSNTWGADPRTGVRLGRDVRWPGVLRKALGSAFEVIEEGLKGRTTVWDDPIEGHKNGAAYLPACLASHEPLDLVIIMLGTNDLKHRFSLTPFDIAAGAGVLVDITQNSKAGPDFTAPQALLVAPPPVGPLTDFAAMYQGAEVKSQQLVSYYRQVAQERHCLFFEAGLVLRSSEIDGIHFDPADHLKLGLALAHIVREALS